MVKCIKKTTLPAGSYTLKINVLGHGHSGSQFYYVVAKTEWLSRIIIMLKEIMG